MSISTKIQDSILLLRIKDDIFINLNDAGPYSSRFIKKTISKFKRKFLLSISSYEADMCNFYDENDNFIKPMIAEKFSAGKVLSTIADVIGANFIIPFSSFHEYQRSDSIWANKFIYPIEKISKCKTIGISSGASAPEILVKEFIESIKKEFTVEIEEVEIVKENVVFKIPGKLN